jgi:hypothetical protein
MKKLPDLTEYCSEELTKMLVEKFDYPKNKTYWVKFSIFDYKRLAKLYEIQTWLRDEHDYHIIVRHPRGFTGDGMEFWKWTYPPERISGCYSEVSPQPLNYDSIPEIYKTQEI